MAVLARLNSNRLRELDGFLSHLLADILVAAGASHHGALNGLREKSTLRRLRAVEMHLGLDFGAEARLIAAARTSAALRRPAGKSCPQRLRNDVRIATEFVEMSGASLLDEAVILTICTFYQSLGDRLIAALIRHCDMGGNENLVAHPAKRIAWASLSQNDNISMKSGEHRS